MQLSSFEGFYIANSARSDQANLSENFLADFINNLRLSYAKLSTAWVHGKRYDVLDKGLPKTLFVSTHIN